MAPPLDMDHAIHFAQRSPLRLLKLMGAIGDFKGRPRSSIRRNIDAAFSIYETGFDDRKLLVRPVAAASLPQRR